MTQDRLTSGYVLSSLAALAVIFKHPLDGVKPQLNKYITCFQDNKYFKNPVKVYSLLARTTYDELLLIGSGRKALKPM